MKNIVLLFILLVTTNVEESHEIKIPSIPKEILYSKHNDGFTVDACFLSYQS